MKRVFLNKSHIIILSLLGISLLFILTDLATKDSEDAYLISNDNSQQLFPVKVYDERIKQFVRNHDKIIRTLEPARFVYVIPTTTGYGNKMVQVINAFMVAMLTDSAVVINMTRVPNYFLDPLPGSFRIHKSAKNETNYLFEPENTYRMPIGTNLTWSPKKSLNSVYTTFPANHTRLVFDGMGAIFYELGCNPIYYAKLMYYGLVKNETVEKALLALKMEKSMNEATRIDYLFRVGFEVGYNILRLFWHPNGRMQSSIDTFYEENLKEYFVIGLQFRFEFIDRSDIKTFFKCAKQIENATYSAKPFKWFVTGDDGEQLLRIKRLYGEKVVIMDGEVSHVGTDARGYERTLMEVEILSKCDEMVLTGGSTFGFLSAMRKGRYPYFVSGGVKMKRCSYFSFSNPSRNLNGYAFM